MAKIPHMDRKKLLTMASAVGLLASGACFLPPPRRPRIHPHVINSVLVKVTDASGSPLLDKDQFGRWIADAINAQSQGQGPSARFGGAAKPGDVVLEVELAQELAKSKPIESGLFEWHFDLLTSLTLSAPNGAALSGLPARLHHWRGPLPVSSPELAWRDPALRVWLDRVANEIAEEFLHDIQPNR